MSATNMVTEPIRLMHPMRTGNVMFTASESASRKSHNFALSELVTVRNYQDEALNPERLNEIIRVTGDPSLGYGRQFKKNMDVEEFLNGN